MFLFYIVILIKQFLIWPVYQRANFSFSRNYGDLHQFSLSNGQSLQVVSIFYTVTGTETNETHSFSSSGGGGWAGQFPTGGSLV